MDQTVKLPEEDGQVNKEGRQKRKYLTMVLENKLPGPPPLLCRKIFAELGLDINTVKQSIC